MTKSDGSWPGQRINMFSITLCTIAVLLGVLTPLSTAGVQQPRPADTRAAPHQRPGPPQQFRGPQPARTPTVSGGPASGMRRRTNRMPIQNAPFGRRHFQDGGRPQFQANAINNHQSNRRQRGLLSSAATSQIFAALKPGAPRPNSQQLNAMIQQGLAMHGLPKNTPLSRLIPLVMKEIRSGRVTPAMIQAAMSSMSSMTVPAQNPAAPPTNHQHLPPNNANFNRPPPQQQQQQQQQHPNFQQQQQQQQHHHMQQQQQERMHHERQMQERHQRELQAKQQQEEFERRQRQDRERLDRQRIEQQERLWHEKRQQDERRHHEQQLHHQHHNQQPHQQPHQLPFRNHQQNQEFNSFPPNNNLRPPQQPINHIDRQPQMPNGPQPQMPSGPHQQGSNNDHVASEAAIRPQASMHNPMPLPEVNNAIAPPPMMNNFSPEFNPGRPHPNNFDHNHHQHHQQQQQHQMPQFMDDDRPLPIPPKPFTNLNFDLFKTMPSVPAMDDGPWIPLTRAPDRDWKPSDARWYMAGSSSSASPLADLDGSGAPRNKAARSPATADNPASARRPPATPVGEMTLVPPTDGFLDDEMMDVLNAKIPKGQHKVESLKEEVDIPNSQESNDYPASQNQPNRDKSNDIGAWQEEHLSSTKNEATVGTSNDITKNNTISEPQATAFASTAEPTSSTEVLAYHSTTAESSETDNFDRQPSGHASFSTNTVSSPHHEAVLATVNDNRDDQSAIFSETLPGTEYNGDVIQNTTWSLKTEAPPQNPTGNTWQQQQHQHQTDNGHRLPSDMSVTAPEMDKEAHPWSPDHNFANMNDGKLLYDHRHQKAEMTSGGYLAVPIPAPEVASAGGQHQSSTVRATVEFDPTREPHHQPPTPSAAVPETEDLTGAFPAFSIEDLASFSKHPLLEEHLPMLRKNNLSHLSVDQLLEHWQNKFDMSYPDAKTQDDNGPKAFDDPAKHPDHDGGGSPNGHQTSERSARSSSNQRHGHFPSYSSAISQHQFLQPRNQNGSDSNQSDSSTSLLTTSYQAALDLRPSDWSRRNRDAQQSPPRGQRDTSTSQPDPTSGRGVERHLSENDTPTTTITTNIQQQPSTTSSTLQYGRYVKPSSVSRRRQSTPNVAPSSLANRPWHQRRDHLFASSKKNLGHLHQEEPLDQAPSSRSDVTVSPSVESSSALPAVVGKYQSQIQTQPPRDSFVGTIDAAAILGDKVLSDDPPPFDGLVSVGVTGISGSSASTEYEELAKTQDTPRRKLTRYLVRRKKIRKGTTSSSFVKNTSSAVHASPEMAYSSSSNA